MARFASSDDTSFVLMVLASLVNFLLLFCGCDVSGGPSQKIWVARPKNFGDLVIVEKEKSKKWSGSITAKGGETSVNIIRLFFFNDDEIVSV
ncbi:hypothetical protein AYI68_g4198 [Smittium mucronatum]|uniref:Uncharacterized protein n=1 Tax=Smittium mucronatum TaxID=133383 RepID=A0A1R0GXS7_9FUNG|nr:hypothetical protein AYI68_g4198 [Smittium mucronatum]